MSNKKIEWKKELNQILSKRSSKAMERFYKKAKPHQRDLVKDKLETALISCLNPILEVGLLSRERAVSGYKAQLRGIIELDRTVFKFDASLGNKESISTPTLEIKMDTNHSARNILEKDIKKVLSIRSPFFLITSKVVGEWIPMDRIDMESEKSILMEVEVDLLGNKTRKFVRNYESHQTLVTLVSAKGEFLPGFILPELLEFLPKQTQRERFLKERLSK